MHRAIRAKQDVSIALHVVDAKKRRVFPMFFASRANHSRTLDTESCAAKQLPARTLRCQTNSARACAARRAIVNVFSCAAERLTNTFAANHTALSINNALANIQAQVFDQPFEKPAWEKNQSQIFENDVARFFRITTKILNGVEMMLVQIFVRHDSESSSSRRPETTAASHLTR
jgi:hypothetical protein